MIFCKVNTFKVAFKVVCLFVTAGMIVYWIAKYLKDEDISVVEYKLVENMTTAFRPEFTICFESPFIEDNLKDMHSNISSQKYLKYLSGDIPGDATYKNIDYENVTIQLFKHLLYVEFRGDFSGGQKFKNCTNIYKCPFIILKNNLNAFFESSIFNKCFGIKPVESYQSNIFGISMVFSRELRPIVEKVGNVYMGFNFPQQLLQDYMGGQYWTNLNTTGYAEWFKITSVELLKRRNKHSQPCFTEWKDFDDLILKQHIKDLGCRAPYMSVYKHLNSCETQEKMKESIIDWQFASKKYSTPCKTASNIGYTFSPVATEIVYTDPSSLVIFLTYAKKIKIISQSRLIDGQALVGYVGGYVGLFLGRIRMI